MAQTVADVMTRDPATIERDDTAAEAARRMAATGAGALIVVDHGVTSGIVTDRDIAVRVVAQDKDPTTPVAEIVSESVLVAVVPETTLDRAADLMRQHSVRRLPVVKDGVPVGVVSLGDLAIEMDDGSALADISAARGNT